MECGRKNDPDELASMVRFYILPKMTEDEQFLAAFEAGTWPFDKWHHREHIRVAYLYLCRHPYEAALEKMRAGIKALNVAQKVPERPDRGYHETVTQAWMRLTHQALREFGKAQSSDVFIETHAQALSKEILLGHYTKERLMSAEARRQFVEPDLRPLPPAPPLEGPAHPAGFALESP